MNPEYCIVLEDQYGPYKTEVIKQRTAYEISRKVHKGYPMYKSKRFRCPKIGDYDL